MKFVNILVRGEARRFREMSRIWENSALACIIMRFPDMSSRTGPASPARPETAYNPRPMEQQVYFGYNS